METYRRGNCPFCGKIIGHPLPLKCPYFDCKRDLSRFLEDPNRWEQQKPPPPLKDRSFLDIRPRNDASRDGQAINRRQTEPAGRVQPAAPMKPQASEDNHTRREASRRKAAPDLRVETLRHTGAGEPSGQARSRSSSPSSTASVRTVWPSPVGASEWVPPSRPVRPDKSKEKAKETAPSTPRSPTKLTKRAAQLSLTASSPSIREWFSRRRGTSQQMESPPPSSSTPPTAPSSPMPSGSATAANTPPTLPVPTSKFRDYPGQRPRRTSPLPVADIDFLRWKSPEELAAFEREKREKGDDADLFMEIFEQYDDSPLAKTPYI
ncbi:hypothetical protein VTK56DRAFT_72 [Thermocarpiscus australiensis]